MGTAYGANYFRESRRVNPIFLAFITAWPSNAVRKKNYIDARDSAQHCNPLRQQGPSLARRVTVLQTPQLVFAPGECPLYRDQFLDGNENVQLVEFSLEASLQALQVMNAFELRLGG